MTGGADRAKDLVDVQQLIKILHLQRDFALRLHEDLRAQYHELWDGLYAAPKKYMRRWQSKLLTRDVGSIDEMIEILGDAGAELREMKADGVMLDPEGGVAGDCVVLVTTDLAVAEKYDMHEASEFFGWDDLDE
jgi:hypothetical protein